MAKSTSFPVVILRNQLPQFFNRDLFQFVLTPVNHWSRRGLFDGNLALWGSWAVIGADGVSKFWHGGDTAYCDAFTQIGKVICLAIL